MLARSRLRLFNTPSQGVGMATAPDFRDLFLTNSEPLAIKEEMPDIDDTDLESVTMKAVFMFPMEEDDIFLVDEADLIGFSQGPTLYLRWPSSMLVKNHSRMILTWTISSCPLTTNNSKCYINTASLRIQSHSEEMLDLSETKRSPSCLM
jgi:hypothetical protein